MMILNLEKNLHRKKHYPSKKKLFRLVVTLNWWVQIEGFSKINEPEDHTVKDHSCWANREESQKLRTTTQAKVRLMCRRLNNQIISYRSGLNLALSLYTGLYFDRWSFPLFRPHCIPNIKSNMRIMLF